MLIFPIENKPDWTRPPVVTIALILINILVFILYQGNDRQIGQLAEEIYHTNNLLTIDREHYPDYLRIKDPKAYRELQAVENDAEREYYLFWSIFFDRGFDQYLRERWQEDAIAVTEAARDWRYHRDSFERQRNQLSSISGGMTPAESSPITFFTSLFLHGGWDHLLGNMIFLFLFGFTLETVLRAHTYLMMYMVSGLAAGGLHWAFNQGSYVPVVGASGAISGLMGMYLALYRLRKIRFFYTVFFYFGEFRAPALFILPLWLAKELYGHFFTESNIAYWAHIGGLLAGALMMLAAQRTHKQFSEELQTQDEDKALETKLKAIQRAITELEFDRAKMLARQLCERYPTDPRPWRQQFDLHKSQPQQKMFHQVSFALLKQFVAEETPYESWRNEVEDILRHYRQLHPTAPALNGPISLALARKFWRNGAPRLSEEFLQRAHEKGVNNKAMLALLTDMNHYYHQRQQTAKAAKTAALLKELQTATPSAPEPSADG